MDKHDLIAELVRVLRDELARAERVAHDTAEAANHPEARPENDKDTRKLELSYLAAGQAARAKELETGIALLSQLVPRRFEPGDALEIGALVECEVDGKPQRVLLSPAGGGLKLRSEGGAVSVVTPASPLGGGLRGRAVGDSFELVLGGTPREVTIVRAS